MEKGQKEEKKEAWFTFGQLKLVIDKSSENWTNISFFFSDDMVRDTKLGPSVRFGIPNSQLPRFIDALAGETEMTLTEEDKHALEIGKKVIKLVKDT